ncbi:MAG: TolB family protein [bacterium]
MKKVLYPLILCLAWQYGGKSTPQNPRINTEGLILVDTLEVHIVFDETPGFKYPMMYHEVKFVGRLSVSGVIDRYLYKSNDISYEAGLDFAGPQPKGTIFRHSHREWSLHLIEAGTPVSYSFSVSASCKGKLVRSLTVDTLTVIERRTDSPQPSPGAVQLTGPSYRNVSPIFSQDGHWIYFIVYDLENHRYTINRMPLDGDLQETIVEIEHGKPGGFALIDGDTKLVDVLRQPNEKSKFITMDLLSGKKEESVIDGFIGASKLIPIPGTQKYVCMSSANTEADLILIDAETKTIDTSVLSSATRRILGYDYRPGTGEISYGIRILKEPGTIWSTVKLLDLNTRETKTFVPKLEGTDLTWAPNGHDFAFIRDGNIFLKEADQVRKITTYPGKDFSPCFSPDGKQITFSSKRRGEYQLWRVKL